MYEGIMQNYRGFFLSKQFFALYINPKIFGLFFTIVIKYAHAGFSSTKTPRNFIDEDLFILHSLILIFGS